ncbi:MAG: serine hydrolase domain-containing protein [Pseudomonadota bacterium]
MRAFLLAALCLSFSQSCAKPQYLERADAFAAGNFNGVVLIGKGRDPEYFEARGVADLSSGAALSPTTIFRTGSVSKLLVSALAFQMAQEGVVDLDAPIANYLPDYPGEGAAITLAHLLSHASGLENDIIKAAREDPSIASANLTTREAAALYASSPLKFTPGAEFDYVHSNWILVKAVLEAAGGESLETLLSDRVFAPLAMTSSGVFSGNLEMPGAASAYETRDANAYARPTPTFMAAAAGVYSNAPDLMRFMHALDERDLFADDLADRFETVVFPGESYAYGGRIIEMHLDGENRRISWQSGSDGPYKIRMARVLDDGWTVIVLENINADPRAASDFAKAILHDIYRTEPRKQQAEAIQ